MASQSVSYATRLFGDAGAHAYILARNGAIDVTNHVIGSPDGATLGQRLLVD